MIEQASEDDIVQAEFRVRGLVQGVGFRPQVWRWAQELGLTGEVRNDPAGLVIRADGSRSALVELGRRIEARAPRLARISRVELCYTGRGPGSERGFRIAASGQGTTRTSVPPDAAICEACRAEIADPSARRRGYALTNCTDCGPRLSIIEAMPYDRARTTMARFAMCADCRAEYANPADRRFHAEPIACPECGPRVRLMRIDATEDEAAAWHDVIAAAAGLLRSGHCVAIKGIGGYQLACDATDADAVARLRAAKRRSTKPFALMARDVNVVRRYAAVSPREEAALRSSAAPIVLLDAPLQAEAGNGIGGGSFALLPGTAPRLDRLGFMLPATPLHVLLLAGFETPLVMTSGNVSDEPQVIDDADAFARLGGIASHVLTHDRPIALRLDDSVVQDTAGEIRVLRRARGYAPAGVPLPPGLDDAPQVLGYGSELKSTFCILKDGAAFLSPHQGDLEDAATLDDYRANIKRFTRLLDSAPQVLACDLHPDYLSTREAEAHAGRSQLSLERVQHHHAHVASCLAENGRPLDAPPVLGIALDGLGAGDDRTIWGGELLIADYRGYRRVGRLKPVAMPGGAAAVREPWRNLYAHLCAALGWRRASEDYADVPAIRQLSLRPLATLDRTIVAGLNAPLSSSCGRLFDAVAAACGLAFERQDYEGEAAMLLEAAAGQLHTPDGSWGPYPFAVGTDAQAGIVEIDTAPMWAALLDDLARQAPPALVAVRFHDGLAEALCRAAALAIQREALAGRVITTVALSGGVLHNRRVLESVATSLLQRGLEVLMHAGVPAGDGGLALGQAMVAAARALGRER